MATSFRGVPNAIHRSRTHAQGSSDSISKSGWREIFRRVEVWKVQAYFVYVKLSESMDRQKISGEGRRCNCAGLSKLDVLLLDDVDDTTGRQAQGRDDRQRHERQRHERVDVPVDAGGQRPFSLASSQPCGSPLPAARRSSIPATASGTSPVTAPSWATTMPPFSATT